MVKADLFTAKAMPDARETGEGSAADSPGVWGAARSQGTVGNRTGLPMKKLKIVWICHFSNAEVRKRLPLAREGRAVADFAPWISNMIQEFKQFENIEIHIISPHRGLKSINCSFDCEGLHYHFFKADIPFMNRRWPHFFRLDAWTGFILNRLLVRYFINQIKPDLINLWGAENSYYSSTILGIKNIPILISIQGIYSNPNRFKLEREDKLRSKFERRVHSENKYFGVSAPFMPELIKRDSPDPILFWTSSVKRIQIPKNCSKEKCYDFVFFARLTPVKGPKDALEALALVKNKKPDVTMRMMGPAGSIKILDELRAQAKALGIEKNVKISGGFALQEDMLKEAARAKFYLLPTVIDTIPGTLFEAIYLDLPVVSYKTGNIPLLNTGETRVLLCERGDIASLANNMIRLLDDPQLSLDLSQKAKEFVEKWFDNRNIALNFIDQYKAVLEHYHHNEPVPASLLYENFMKTL